MISVDNEVISLTEKGYNFTTGALEYITMNKTSELENIKEDFFLFRG